VRRWMLVHWRSERPDNKRADKLRTESMTLTSLYRHWTGSAVYYYVCGVLWCRAFASFTVEMLLHKAVTISKRSPANLCKSKKFSTVQNVCRFWAWLRVPQWTLCPAVCLPLPLAQATNGSDIQIWKLKFHAANEKGLSMHSWGVQGGRDFLFVFSFVLKVFPWCSPSSQVVPQRCSPLHLRFYLISSGQTAILMYIDQNGGP
jgi:hypothetical protein